MQTHPANVPLFLLAGLLLPLSGAYAADLEARVQLLERRVQALSEMVLRVDGLQLEVQQLRGELELQNHAMEALKKRQRDLYLDIDSRLSGSGEIAGRSPSIPQSSAAAAATPPAPAIDRIPATPSPKPEPLRQATEATSGEERDYQRAFELLTQRRYDEAGEAFKRFLAKYPGGLYADNAQYWLGEASYVTRDFDVALAEFSKVLTQYPNSSKVAGAMLKIGYIQFDLQQLDKSRKTLDSLIQRYPGTSASRLAQEFIRKKKI